MILNRPVSCGRTVSQMGSGLCGRGISFRLLCARLHYCSELVMEIIRIHYTLYGESIPVESRLEWVCLVHAGVRDKRRGYDIDLTHPRHETAFWWRHNEPVTSQSTDLFKWLIYPWHLVEIYGHINTCNKVFMAPICRTSTPVQLCLIHFILVELGSW